MSTPLGRGAAVLVLTNDRSCIYEPGVIVYVTRSIDGDVRYDVEGVAEAAGKRWPAARESDLIADRLVAS